MLVAPSRPACSLDTSSLALMTICCVAEKLSSSTSARCLKPFGDDADIKGINQADVKIDENAAKTGDAGNKMAQNITPDVSELPNVADLPNPFDSTGVADKVCRNLHRCHIIYPISSWDVKFWLYLCLGSLP